MPNPFDQFDEQQSPAQANPFDQFDAQSSQPNQMATSQLMEDPLGNQPPIGPEGWKPDLLDDPFAYSPPVQQQAKPKEPAGYWERVGQTNPLAILDSMASGMTNAAYFGFDDEIAGAASKAGVPGLDNYKANQDRMRAEQPSAFMGGQMSTAFAPFGAANAILKPKTILGTSALGGATGSAQGGLQGFGDTDGTFSNRLEGGNEGAKAGALFGAALGGGLAAAPRAISAMKGGEGRSQLGDILEGIIEPGTVDASGIKALDRFLAQNKIRLDDNTVRRINSSINSAIELGADSASLPVRLKDVLVESLDGGGGKFAQALQDQLQGTMNIGGDGAKTIFNAIDEDLPAARKAIKAQFDSVLGAKSRFAEEGRINEVLSQISAEGYRPIFARGIQSQEGAKALEDFLSEPGIIGSNKKLREAAELGLGRDLDDFIKKQPLEAAHWVQSRAGEMAQAASDAGDTFAARNWGEFRNRALKAINKAAPGYDNVRKMYGDEFSNQEAHGFAKRFIAKVSGEEGPYQIDVLKEKFKGFSPAEQEAALISLRDMLKATTGKGWAEKGPQLTRLLHENVQEAFGEVFGKEGAEIIKSVNSAKRFIDSRIRPDTRNNSQTGPNIEASKTARANVESPMRRKVGGALQSLSSDAALSSGFGAFAPVRTVGNTLGALGKAVSGDSSGKLNALAKLLEAPVNPRGMAGATPQPSALAELPVGLGVAPKPVLSGQSLSGPASKSSQMSAPLEPIPAKKAAAQAPAAAADRAKAPSADFVKALRDVGEDRQAFDAVMAELEKASVPEVIAAARSYAPTSTKSKKEALGVIRREFSGRIRQRLKREQSGEATPW